MGSVLGLVTNLERHLTLAVNGECPGDSNELKDNNDGLRSDASFLQLILLLIIT